MIEILLVFALLAILPAVALVTRSDTYRGTTFRSDRDILISALEHARAESMNGICLGNNCADAEPHGVSIQSQQYVIFQGAHYASRDAIKDSFIPASPLTAHTGISEVVFSVLSGTTTPGQIILTDQSGHVSTI